MPKEVIGSLSVDLELLSAKFEQGAKTANGHLSTLSKSANTLNKVFSGLLVVGGGAAFTGVIKGSLDAANRLGDLSSRLGVTVEGLSRLEYAASLTGVSSSTLAMGLQRATRRIAEAANGSGEAVGALNELGLSAKKLNELRPEQQFEVLADALEGVPNQADKVRLAMKLLDSGGVSLLQTMKGGSAEIRRLGEESDRTGNTISTDFANKATEANAAIIKMQAASTGLTNQFAVTLGPTIAEVAGFLGDNLPSAANFTSKAFRMMAAGATESLSYIVEALRTVTYYGGFLSDDIAEADQAMYELQENLRGATDVIFENMDAATTSTKKFKVELGQALPSLESFKGETLSNAAATKQATEEAKKYAEILKEFETVQSSLQTEEEAETADYESRIAALEAFGNARKENEVLANQLIEQERIRHKQALQAIADTENNVEGATSDFESIRESLLTEEQAEIESYQRRIAQIEAYQELSFMNELEGNALLEEERARHQAALTDIEDREAKKRKAVADAEAATRYKNASALFGNLSTLMNSKSKKLFQIGKAAAIANAIVNTSEGVTKALAQGGGIFGPALAATVAAAGMVQIQQIRSQSFGGGGSVNAGGGSPGTFNPPQPNIPTAPTVPDANGERPINLYVHRDVQGNISLADQLEDVRDFIEETDFVLITNESRNGQDLANQ